MLLNITQCTGQPLPPTKNDLVLKVSSTEAENPGLINVASGLQGSLLAAAVELV